MDDAIRLLIVDDELHVRESLSRWFIEDGYEAETASGAKEALAVLGRRRFDVVITDIKMPKPDGIEVLQYVQDHSPNTRVIMITGFATVETAREAMKKVVAERMVQFGQAGNADKVPKLTLEDMQGGTFTISNGGVYGSMLSTPILNPPQSGILGMHRIDQRPVAIGDEVVLIGRQKEAEVTVEQLASLSENINYEFLARLSPMIPRVVV